VLMWHTALHPSVASVGPCAVTNVPYCASPTLWRGWCHTALQLLRCSALYASVTCGAALECTVAGVHCGWSALWLECTVHTRDAVCRAALCLYQRHLCSAT
jgi:hypothetical protein